MPWTSITYDSSWLLHISWIAYWWIFYVISLVIFHFNLTQPIFFMLRNGFYLHAHFINSFLIALSPIYTLVPTGKKIFKSYIFYILPPPSFLNTLKMYMYKIPVCFILFLCKGEWFKIPFVRHFLPLIMFYLIKINLSLKIVYVVLLSRFYTLAQSNSTLNK